MDLRQSSHLIEMIDGGNEGTAGADTSLRCAVPGSAVRTAAQLAQTATAGYLGRLSPSASLIL